MAVIAGPPGIAYVGWLSDNARQGFAQYLRPFSISSGWLAKPIRVSRQFGNPNVWPGDTIGISLLPAGGHNHRRSSSAGAARSTAGHHRSSPPQSGLNVAETQSCLAADDADDAERCLVGLPPA
jgi:hypothetical protein